MLCQIHLSPVILIFLNLSLLYFSHSAMVCKYYFLWKNQTRQKLPSLFVCPGLLFSSCDILPSFFKGFFIYLILHPYFAVISSRVHFCEMDKSSQNWYKSLATCLACVLRMKDWGKGKENKK